MSSVSSAFKSKQISQNQTSGEPQTLKAFEHYTSKGEKQKLAALKFILQNMDQHYAMSNILREQYDSILSPKEYGYQIPNTDDKNGIALRRLITMEKKYAKIKPRLTKIKYDVICHYHQVHRGSTS